MPEAVNRCLLLVEDDPLVRDTISLMLEEEGFEVVEAADARAAMLLVRNGLNAQLIVTDVDLGPGPSGAELADQLHALRPDVGVIFITGRTASLKNRPLTDREAVLPKPFEVSDLSRLVRLMSA